MKYSHLYSTLLVILSLHLNVQAQSTFVPEHFGSAINSAYDDILPVLSPEGTILYFTRLNHPDNTYGVKNSADVWYSQLHNGQWSIAQRLAAFNIGHYNSLLSISADGKEALLYGDKGLSLAKKTGDTWGAPELLKIKASKDASLSADGQHVVYSKGGKIYLLTKQTDGTWGKAVALQAIHVKKEITPFLTADNKTLYFASDRRNKQFDIYKTTRTGSDWVNWSVPVALNDTINTAQQESYFKTNANGSWGYYTSVSTEGKSDIYQVKVYEDNPFVLVKGTVVNAVTKRPLRGKRITWLANGKPVDSVKFNADSATFRVKLPMRHNYELVAEVDHYKTYPLAVEAANVKEYTVVIHDLDEGPVPYVLLKGKLLIKNTDQAIPAKAKPGIVVDGEVIDSARIEADGTYSIKLKHGASYYVQVSAKRFESFPALVELEKYDGYEEIVLDLQADAEKMAIVTGTILNKKSNKPMDSTVHTAIQVEGISSVYAVIDSLTGAYELRLPLHARYAIGAGATSFYPVYESVDVTNESNEVKLTKDLLLVPVERGQSVPLNGVYFEPGKVKLLEESAPELDRLVAFLTEHPKVRIEVDADTYKNTNLSTATAAKAVVTYLTSKGIAAGRLTSHGYGTSRTAGKSATEGGKQSVRIEFVFTGL